MDIPFWQKGYSVMNPLSVNEKPQRDEFIVALVMFGCKSGEDFLLFEKKFVFGHLGYDSWIGAEVLITEEGSKWAFEEGKTPKTIVNMFWNYVDELCVREGKKDEVHS